LDKRLTQLENWLDSDLKLAITDLQSASEDASFRRYFRVTTAAKTYIAMDAPPERENCKLFIAAATTLAAQQIHTPAIFHQHLEQGFLLIEDLGNRVYLPELKEAPDRLYTDAIEALIRIQNGAKDQPDVIIPEYTATLFDNEMELFIEWFLKRHLGLNLETDMQNVWANTKSALIDVCRSQPQVWVHRDYHSRNLMVTDTNSPGVIDFQDMVLGPIAYDLASIFKDCYIEWPRNKQHRWISEYYSALPASTFSLDELIRWVDLTGLQRHLKVLGIFCRLNYRDDKDEYLANLPLVAKYVLECLSLYPELSKFEELFAPLIRKSL